MKNAQVIDPNLQDSAPDDVDYPVAMVTGATGGIGIAIVEHLRQSGFRVMLVDLANRDVIEAAAGRIDPSGEHVGALSCDVADISGHAALVQAIVDRFGRLDCLVNCAGVSVLSRGDILDVTPESYDRCFRINARAVFFLSQAVARYFLNHPAGRHHRSIITISSSSADAISINRAEYCASKAAAAMITRCFAVRLAGDGVGVYDIRPGLIETPMTLGSKEKYDRLIAEGLAAIPRWGKPDDVAATIAVLAEGRIPYTVGHPFWIDGGLVLRRYS